MRQTDVYNGGVFAEDYLSMNNGNVYFLDPQNGNDGNSGKSITQAFKTLPYAYSKLTANQHDRLYYIAGPGKCNLTAPFVWAKNFTHFIGCSPPISVANRCRIYADTGLVANPFFTISATGCVFKNLLIQNGAASATTLVNVDMTGARCYFENVQFGGMANSTASAPAQNAGGRSLRLNGAQENLFYRCTIGEDTVQRTTTNTELECIANSGQQAVRNVFDYCIFQCWSSSAGHLFISATATSSVDRYLMLRDCIFHVFGTGMTQAVNWAVGCGGDLLCEYPSMANVTAIQTTTSGNVWVSGGASLFASGTMKAS